MADKKILDAEMMSDDELDNVIGGSAVPHTNQENGISIGTGDNLMTIDEIIETIKNRKY